MQTTTAFSKLVASSREPRMLLPVDAVPAVDPVLVPAVAVVEDLAVAPELAPDLEEAAAPVVVRVRVAPAEVLVVLVVRAVLAVRLRLQLPASPIRQSMVPFWERM